MLKTEKLFTMNYYPLKVACTTQRYADVICLTTRIVALYIFNFPVYFQSFLQY